MPQVSQYTDQGTQNLRERATERVEDMAERATGRLRGQAGGRMQDMAGHFKGAVDKSVRDQPMATLALVAVAGFVLGAIWKR